MLWSAPSLFAISQIETWQVLVNMDPEGLPTLVLRAFNNDGKLGIQWFEHGPCHLGIR